MVSSEDPLHAVTEYTTQIYTTNARGSGTDAQCTLHGANGDQQGAVPVSQVASAITPAQAGRWASRRDTLPYVDPFPFLMSGSAPWYAVNVSRQLFFSLHGFIEVKRSWEGTRWQQALCRPLKPLAGATGITHWSSLRT
jgi:hypothetical protein